MHWMVFWQLEWVCIMYMILIKSDDMAMDCWKTTQHKHQTQSTLCSYHVQFSEEEFPAKNGPSLCAAGQEPFLFFSPNSAVAIVILKLLGRDHFLPKFLIFKVLTKLVCKVNCVLNQGSWSAILSFWLHKGAMKRGRVHIRRSQGRHKSVENESGDTKAENIVLLLAVQHTFYIFPE